MVRSKIRRENQLRLVVYPIIYKILYIPGGCLGFLPSTVNSMTPKFARETFVETLARVPGGDCFPLNVPRDLSQMSNIQSLMTFHETDWFIGVLKSPKAG